MAYTIRLLRDLQDPKEGGVDYGLLREVLLAGNVRITTTYPYENIEDVQGIFDHSSSTGADAVRLFEQLGTRFQWGSAKDIIEDVRQLFKHLEHDEDTLNWLIHAQFCERWMAGNDLNLIEMVLDLPNTSKLALLLCTSTFAIDENLADRYTCYLDEALRRVCAFSSQARCKTIDPLPVNFELTDFNESQFNTEAGIPGQSTIILNASPVSTLPKALAGEIAAKYGGSLTQVSKSTLEQVKTFALPTEQSISMASTTLQFSLKATTTSFELRQTIRAQSHDLMCFEDIFTTDWNNFYPVSQGRFEMVSLLDILVPGNNALDEDDAQAISALFSKQISYASLTGETPESIMQAFVRHGPFFQKAFVQPEVSLYHNFMHRDGVFGEANIDAYIAYYEQEILGGYISRFCSPAACTSELGERLLGYLGSLHSVHFGVPEENNENLHHPQTMAKLAVMIMRKGTELGVMNLKQLNLHEFLQRTGLNQSGLHEFASPPVCDRDNFLRAMITLPQEWLTIDIMLCCGLGLSAQELENADESQLERSLTLDMGL